MGPSSTGAERATVKLGRRPPPMEEMMPQHRSGTKAGSLSHLLHRMVGLLEHSLRQLHPLRQQPLMRSCARDVDKPSGKGSGRHVGAPGEVPNTQRLIKAPLSPGQDGGEVIASVMVDHRHLDELCL